MVLTVSFAACVGGAAEPLESAAPTFVPEHDEETGSVTGTVVDESLLPIANGIVTLLTPDGTAAYMVTRTSDGGRYAFNFIPAGKYQVEAKANGFEPLALTVDIVAGDVLERPFRLVQGFADVAYYVTDHLSKMIGGGTLKYGFECAQTPFWQQAAQAGLSSYLGKYCIGGNQCQSQFGCTDGASGCLGSYSKETGVDDNGYGGTNYNGGYRDLLRNDTWKTQLAELTWTQSSAVSGRGVLFEVLGPNVTNGDGLHTSRCGSINQSDPRDFLVLSDTPPIRLEINEALLSARQVAPEDHCCDWRLRLFPGWCDLGNCARWGPDANVLGVVAPTRVEIYYTIFFKEPAPPGWSTLEDK